MMDRQTLPNRLQKRPKSLPLREEGVILEPAEMRGFRDLFAGNRSEPYQELGGMNGKRRDGLGPGRANRNVRLGGRSWVYFCQRGEGGPIKIGRTRQLSSRVTALQSVCPEDVILLGQLPETDITERRVHIVFNRHRIRGEWFRPAPEILELAAAGEALYPGGLYSQDIPESREDEWLIVLRYADRPRVRGGPSPFDLVGAQLERLTPSPAGDGGW